jgi:hypothetical protein
MLQDDDRQSFARRLESAGLVVLEDETYRLSPAEADLLTQEWGDGRAKNISLSPDGTVRGTSADRSAAAPLAAMMGRFAAFAREAVLARAPEYASGLEFGRTSYRPRPIDDAPISPRKDDRRLHADAFTSQPTGGARILRVFANVNPHGEARVWRVGEPFEAYAQRFLPRTRIPSEAETWLVWRAGLTRRRRTAYDALMLGLHDAAKLDADYQRDAPRRVIEFPPATIWIAFTDALVHAAIRGRFALEQTFYLPLSAMVAPEAAPASILERLAAQRLC